MNAPIVWIVFPGIISAVLYFIRRWTRLSTFLGIGLAIVMSGLAAWINIGVEIRFYRWSLLLTDTLTIFGRRFVLDNSARPALFIIYFVTAFWLGGVITAKAGKLAVSLGLGFVVLLTAAYAVDPFLYAALLIEMAVLASIPLLTRTGWPVGRGVLRFLVFQTLGMMLLLFSGWIMEGIEANPDNQSLVMQAAIITGLGFALLLAVIPFQTWIPMLAEEAHPYTAGLVFLMLPELIMLFGLSFLDRYTWLRETTTVYDLLRLAGVLSIFIGGWMSATQQHLGRILGYIVIVEIGYSLLTIGTTGGLPLHFALLMPRVLGFGVFTLALSAIRTRFDGLDIHQVQGAAQHLPLAAAGVIVAQFALAGFPLLAGFPVHLALWETVGKQHLWAALWSLLGSAGLVVAGMRSMVALFTNRDNTTWRIGETRAELFFLGVGIAALLITGLFSQFYFPTLTGLAQGLEYITP